jgi:hypothetical protein
VLDLRVVGNSLACVEEGQSQLPQRDVRALVEEPHRLARVEHRAAAYRHDAVGAELAEHLGAGLDLLLGRLRVEVGEDVDARALEVAAHLVGHAARLAVDVGDQQDLLGLDLAQAL